MNKIKKVKPEDYNPKDYPKTVEALEGEDNFRDYVIDFFKYQSKFEFLTAEKIQEFIDGIEAEYAGKYSMLSWPTPWNN